jgi:hypothetical protein
MLMRRLFAVMIFMIGLTLAAQAHAPYIVAEGGDAAKAIVIFSDELKPDDRIKEATWKKMSGLKLVARNAAGTETPVEWSQGEHCLKCAAPVGTQVIYGRVEYGTFAKGENKPMFLVYYPKTILGAIPADAGNVATAGLDVLPKVEAGKVRFQVLLNGKPTSGIKLSLILPEGAKDKAEATTDEQGLTQAFEAKGRYGVTARFSETKSGESAGVKYETVMHVATLVVDVK